MKISVNLAFRIGAIGLSLALAACSSFAHSYMSPEERQAHGRQLLQEAVQQSDVVSVRAGVVSVWTAVELRRTEFCADMLAIRGTTRWNDNWSHRDRGGRTPPRLCRSYHGIESIRPKDMRNCQGSECLWLRGL